MPSMPTHQLLSQGQQEGSQRPLPALGCPPPPTPPASSPLHSSCGFRLEHPGSALEGGNPGHRGPWPLGTSQPLRPCGGSGLLLSPKSSASPSGFQLCNYPPSSSPSLTFLRGLPGCVPFGASQPRRQGGAGAARVAGPCTDPGRVSIPLCGHVSFHHLRGAGRLAPPESLSSFPSAHTECPQASYLQLREQDRCSGRSGRCTRSLGVRTWPCRQTDARVGAPDHASHPCDPAAQSPVATPVCSPGGCSDAGWCLLVSENHSLPPSLGAVPLEYDTWARAVGTVPLLPLPGSRAAQGPGHWEGLGMKDIIPVRCVKWDPRVWDDCRWGQQRAHES